MFHALRNEVIHFAQDDGMAMFIGPDRQGQLIEVGLIEWNGEIVIAHSCKPARDKYLRWLR
jgi:hypothetical protein